MNQRGSVAFIGIAVFLLLIVGIGIVTYQQAKIQNQPDVFITPTLAAPSGEHFISYIGCSNSKQSVAGYHTVSSDAYLWPSYDTGGLSIDKWADETNRAWKLYDDMARRYGTPKEAWIQVCERKYTMVSTTEIEQTIKNLRDRTPEVIIHLSPLNDYVQHQCDVVVDGTNEHIVQLVNEVYAKDHTIQKGPVLGPLDTDTLTADHCHPNDKGMKLLGNQLNDYFKK